MAVCCFRARITSQFFPLIWFDHFHLAANVNLHLPLSFDNHHRHHPSVLSHDGRGWFVPLGWKKMLPREFNSIKSGHITIPPQQWDIKSGCFLFNYLCKQLLIKASARKCLLCTEANAMPDIYNHPLNIFHGCESCLNEEMGRISSNYRHFWNRQYLSIWHFGIHLNFCIIFHFATLLSIARDIYAFLKRY